VEKIHISDSIKVRLPDIRLGLFHAEVQIQPSSADLLRQIDFVLADRRSETSIESVSRIQIIAETKDAYRKLGKDPSRYRPSAEALIRRIVQGKGLYQVNKIVDALNMVSIKHGFSIGGYDVKKIIQPVTLDAGQRDEPYEAIGRGKLNIEQLPVLRDAQGAFGSPTSDSLRTMVGTETRSFMMVFFDFMKSELLEHALKDTNQIFRDYCGVTKIETSIYS